MGDVHLGMERLLLWTRATSTTLAAAITGTSETTLTLTSATDTADATALLPVKAMIDNEVVYITTSGTTPTISRAEDGTTAATHLIGATVLLLVPVQVEKTADWTPNADIQDIAVPGDGSVEHINRLQGLAGTLTFNKWSDKVLTVAMGVPEVTSGVGMPSDLTSMMHPAEGDYPLVQMDVDIVATDGDNFDAYITKRFILWQTKLQKPFVPGAAGNNALQSTPLTWSAQPVTTNLFGTAIPGMTTAQHMTIGKVA
jgi:hypothetical protein